MTDPVPIAALVTSVKDDPDVRLAIKGLVLDTIARARDLLDTTLPMTQLQVVRIVLPAATRALQTGGDDEDMKDLKQAMTEMYGDVRKALDA